MTLLNPAHSLLLVSQRGHEPGITASLERSVGHRHIYLMRNRTSITISSMTTKLLLLGLFLPGFSSTVVLWPSGTKNEKKVNPEYSNADYKILHTPQPILTMLLIHL